jgi:hypothetical protein
MRDEDKVSAVPIIAHKSPFFQKINPLPFHRIPPIRARICHAHLLKRKKQKGPAVAGQALVLKMAEGV